MKSFLLRFLRAVLIGLVSLIAMLLGLQHKLIYHPRGYDEAELSWLEHLGAKRWEVTTSQGRQTAFYLPSLAAPEEPPAFLWLVTGGNGSLSLDYAEHRSRWDPRFAYLFIDYPGYGLCEGSPSPATIQQTLSALRTTALSKLGWTADVLAQRTGVLGHSLGSAVALIAADEWQLRAAVLCTPFTTLTDMARLLLGSPLCHLNRHRFDNFPTLATLQQRGGRATLIHGTHDEVIPTRMSQELHARFQDATELIIVPKAMHNDIFHLASKQIAQAMLMLSGLAPR